MKFRFKKKVGEIEFEFEQEVSAHTEFFDAVEFFSSLPATGPNGETDLRFAHRTPQGYDYFEIISDKAGQRFCFGEHKNAKGSLFPKSWEPIFQGSDEPRHDERESQSRPRPVENRPSAQTAISNVDAQIREQFQRLGITNAGQEKNIIMKALNMRVGMLLVELQPTEKGDLLDFLEKQDARRAA